MATGVSSETLKYRDAANGGLTYYLSNGKKVLGANPDGITYHDGVIINAVTSNGQKNTQIITSQDFYERTYGDLDGYFNEDRIYKSDYLALRNISLEYNFPQSIYRVAKLKGQTFSIFANNVAYLYKAAPNTTPESVNGTSGKNATVGTTLLPSQRSIGASLKIKL